MPGRNGITRLAAAALMALALAACQESIRATAPAASATPAPARPSPTPAIPIDLTPITISGTPVIIASAIQFTPSPTAPSAAAATRCPYPWFFANPPQWCPSTDGAARAAVLQPFERARMLSIADGGSTSSVTVLFADQNFWFSTPAVAPAQPDAGTAIDPALYGLWRDGTFFDQPLRESVGAPSGPAVHYPAHRQCEVATDSYTITRCFVDLPDGRVILLYADADIGRAATSWSDWKGE